MVPLREPLMLTITALTALSNPADARLAAETMATSEPWLTLGRTFDESLAIVRDASKEVFVAHDDGQFRGFLILSPRSPLGGYIQIVAVAAEARGTGIGSRLLDFAEERIFRESANAFLCVSGFNTGARSLYQRRGYVEIGVLHDFLVRGHDEILMRKTIGPIREITNRGA
jgi:ribosomal-protein-alanine N-acetyltransferase